MTEELKEYGKKRLKKSYCRGVTLIFIGLVNIFIVFQLSFITYNLCIKFFNSSKNTALILSITVFFVFYLLILKTVDISLKHWFYNLEKKSKFKLYYWGSFEKYLKALYFEFVKFIAIALVFIICTAPAFFIYKLKCIAPLGYSLNMIDGFYNILMFLSIFLGAYCYLYFYTGVFFCDYLYISNNINSPVKAIITSLNIMGMHRIQFLKICLSIIHYFLMSLFVFPIVLLFPILYSIFSSYSQYLINNYMKKI